MLAVFLWVKLAQYSFRCLDPADSEMMNARKKGGVSLGTINDSDPSPGHPQQNYEVLSGTTGDGVKETPLHNVVNVTSI